jgi:hypothetical protein
MAARNKYLNNKELLKEIHESKTSFSEFDKPEYHRFDAIVEEYDDLFTYTERTEDIIDEATGEVTGTKGLGEMYYPIVEAAQVAKAARMAAEDYAAKMAVWEEGPKKASDKPRLVDCKFDPTTLPEDELIYRGMTFEHIPLEPGRKKNPRKESEHYAKLNFIPFKHYMITDMKNKKAVEVGRSHSKDGEFCQIHGAMTDKLAVMYMLLVERYSQRSNWRGYTYLDEMKGQSLLQLSSMGLQFNEAKSNNPFAYYTQALTHSFTRVLNIEKKNQDIRDKILVNKGLTPSFSKQIEHENKLRQMREDAANNADGKE